MIILLRVLLIITFFKFFNIKRFNSFYKFIKYMKSFLISISWVLWSLKSYKILSVVCTLLVPIKSLFYLCFIIFLPKRFLFLKRKIFNPVIKNEGKFLLYQNFCCFRWLFRSCIKPSSNRSQSSRSTRLYASVGNGVNSTSTIQNSIILNNNENEIGGEGNSLNRMEVVPMIRNHTSAPDIRKGRIYYSGLRNWLPWS